MEINVANFLLFTAALGAGGAGGYMYRDAKGGDASKEPTPTPAPSATEAPAPVASASAVEPSPSASASALAAGTAAPSCNDDVGTPADCPIGGPSDEGMCAGGGQLAARRCVDFKAAFKPKVAESAVACLRKLSRNEQCDPRRVDLCGHQALMVACQDDVPDTHESVTTMNASTAPPLTSAPDSIAAQCDTIVKGCSGAVIGASFADCYRTLSGMTPVGRTKAVECMKTHCHDKGLAGCEAAGPFPPAAPGK